MTGVYSLTSITIRRNVEPRCRVRFEITLSGGLEFLGADWLDPEPLELQRDRIFAETRQAAASLLTRAPDHGELTSTLVDSS